LKITDAEIIKTGETDLIEQIRDNLDWDAVKEAINTKYNIDMENGIQYKAGDLVVYQDDIAYQLDFDFKENLRILINRDGEQLDISVFGEQPVVETKDETYVEPTIYEEASKAAAEIADMIATINQ